MANNNVLIAALRAEIREIEATIRQTDKYLVEMAALQERRRERLTEFRAALEKAEKNS